MTDIESGRDSSAAVEDGDRVERMPGIIALSVLYFVTAVVFAWGVWAAVGNLIQVPALFDQYRDFVASNGAPELAKTTPWPALIAALLLPVVGWFAAWRLGRRRGVLQRIVIFVIAYAAVSALTVSLTGYVFQVSSVL